MPQLFTIDEVTADNMGSMNIWPRMYQVIRKANTIFARINECEELTAQDKREIVDMPILCGVMLIISCC